MERYYVSPSATVTKLLIDLAESNGWKVCETFKEEYNLTKNNADGGDLVWPIFVFDFNFFQKVHVWGRHRHHEDGERINLEEMVKCLEIKSQISEFTLNKDYIALIDKYNKTVKVGCQTFSFDVLRELVAKFD